MSDYDMHYIHAVAIDIIEYYSGEPTVPDQDLVISCLIAAATLARANAGTMEEYVEDIDDLSNIFKDICINIEAQRRKDRGVIDGLTEAMDEDGSMYAIAKRRKLL